MTFLPEIQCFLKCLFQVCLVYITGLIVWVWCNRNPDEGLNAVQQTDRVALKSGTRSSSMVMAGHSSSHSGHNGAKKIMKSYLIFFFVFIKKFSGSQLSIYPVRQYDETVKDLPKMH